MKILLLVALMSVSFCTYSQSIIPWTEKNGTLGLGYPVPIPVDTTEPFDGFRTYAGIFAKHQSIAMNNPYVTGHIVGQTRAQRDIWAYVLSDEGDLTQYGVKEGAMLINGTIHAREWQSPEVMTGIMELLDANSDDHSIHQFLLENTSLVMVPVNNVDGFLQTQRYPTENWYNAQIGPRDGRMRRKNMLDVDEDLQTQADYLLGVDLNRNNSPYWATSNNSSFNATSIVYHGATSESEPETQARLNAAALVLPEQLRLYCDIHSFSQVQLSVATNIQNRNLLQFNLLKDFTLHHNAYAARKSYKSMSSGPNFGIGSTDEYFAETYEIPSWTLEIEPTGRGAVDYGGFGRNGHDGFILPESQIKRVREELAQSFMVVLYEQSGPPSITQLRVVEKNSHNIIYDARWDIQQDGTRLQVNNEVDNIIVGGEYSLLISFDKPMRVRNEAGQVIHLQGQSGFSLDPEISSEIGGVPIEFVNGSWINEKSNDVFSYKFYKDDSYVVDFSIPEDTVLVENASISFAVDVADMIGQKLDANPQTVVTWDNGQWQNYEDTENNLSIVGGIDSHYSAPLGLTNTHTFQPAVQPTGLYYDPSRSGEGFSYELLGTIDNLLWLQWFTYDSEGNQRWYSGLGKYDGNRIIVNTLTQASGGLFGEGFDAANIAFDDFGSLEVIFSGGEAIDPPIGFDSQERTGKVIYTDRQGKKLETNMLQLSYVQGAINSTVHVFPPTIIINPLGAITGSWYDPNRSGEGYIIEILEDGRAILIWYTYDLDGNLMWLIDSDGVVTVEGNDIGLDFNNVQVSDGGVFGEDFDPNSVNFTHWGTLNFQLNCQGEGTVNYSSVLQGFGSGQYSIFKLTHPLIYPAACEQ